MAELASPGWIQKLADAAARLPTELGPELTVEQRVTGADPTSWHVALVDGRVSVGAGPTPDPTITITSSRETASAIHAGSLSAQRAFLDGDLRIGGDLGLLIEHRNALADVAARLADAAT